MDELPDAQNLITLLALHEAGSESAAGDALGIGQSSVSRRLAGLQRLAAEPLTVRTATGTKLTQAGLRLLPHARAARAALGAAARWLADEGLRVTSVGLDPALVPRLAGAVAGLAPGVTVREAGSRELVELVRDARLDAAAVLWAPAGSEPGLTSARLPPDELAVVAAPGLRLAPRGELDPAALRDLTLFLPGAEGEVAGRALAVMRAAQVEPAGIADLGSPAAVRAAVNAGAGVGVGLASEFATEAVAGWLTLVKLGADGAITPRLLVSDQLPVPLGDRVRVALGLAPLMAAPQEEPS